jgi:glutamine amidotransferase
MITIVDYGLGNIRSLTNWFKRGNVEVNFTDDVTAIRNSDVIILPGVGAYEDAMKKLDEKGLSNVIVEEVRNGKPIVGICLGMQLLYEKSYEGGLFKGLGLIKGDIVPFDKDRVKVPHMGWNELVSSDERWTNNYVYFVHSYYVDSALDEVIAYANYDIKVPSIVKKDRILGFQFHPEKSGDNGQEMLKLIEELRNDYLSSNRYT